MYWVNNIEYYLSIYSDCFSGYSTCPSAGPFLEWFASDINVAFAQYSDSDHWFINVTWTPMNGSYCLG